MGLGMLGFALAPTLPFAFAALAVGGFFFMLTNTGATTALTLEVAPEQRGRVMALWSLCFLGTRPPASLVDGAVASTVGLRPAGVALTVPVLAAGVAMAVLRRRVPRLRRGRRVPARRGRPPAAGRRQTEIGRDTVGFVRGLTPGRWPPVPHKECSHG